MPGESGPRGRPYYTRTRRENGLFRVWCLVFGVWCFVSRLASSITGPTADSGESAVSEEEGKKRDAQGFRSNRGRQVSAHFHGLNRNGVFRWN
jgi:hypothetical protein